MTNPHPIGTLAYWQHHLADYEQRAKQATAEGFPIKARGFRDDCAEIRTIIDRINDGIGETRYAEALPPERHPEVRILVKDALYQMNSCLKCGKQCEVEGAARCRICMTANPDSDPALAAIPEAPPRDGKNFKSCIGCGKRHQGGGWRCRDCKTAYRNAGDWAAKERERKKQRDWYAKRVDRKKQEGG